MWEVFSHGTAMDTNKRLRHLIALRVKLKAMVIQCDRKILALEKERKDYLDHSKEAYKEIISHRKNHRVFWWWPWGD